MDTRTGRIFEPEVMERLNGAMVPVEYAELEAAREALLAGALVPVSDEVVQKVRLGDRELERRRRRRIAAKLARRSNRS